VVHKLYETDGEAKLNFVKWYLHGVHDGHLDLHTCSLMTAIYIIATARTNLVAGSGFGIGVVFSFCMDPSGLSHFGTYSVKDF
jgi:hypothetical protein